MVDNLMTRLQELTVILYALAYCYILLIFFIITGRQIVLPSGYFHLYGFFKQFYCIIYMVNKGRFPVLTIFEGLYFYAWVLITFSLVINRLLRVDFIVFFTNVIGFMIMVIHTFAPDQVESESQCTAAGVRVAIDSYYSGHSILWCFFAFFCFFTSVFNPIQFIETKKMGEND